jgi:hypothetical protein
MLVYMYYCINNHELQPNVNAGTQHDDFSIKLFDKTHRVYIMLFIL